MANEHNPNDPYRTDLESDRSNVDDTRRRLSSTMSCRSIRNSPKVPPSSGRIALFAVGIALVLGVVFYGLNNSPAPMRPRPPRRRKPRRRQPASPPAAPPGMRDVTPRAPNSQPGMTTGSAPTSRTPPAGHRPTGQCRTNKPTRELSCESTAAGRQIMPALLLSRQPNILFNSPPG